MIFYKNSELAKEYSVSLPTIGNWIKDTLSGKKKLELVSLDGKNYVSKTSGNIELMKKYVVEGFKYKPSNVRVLATPNPDYIKYLSDKQLIEIKKGLIDKKQLDLKYCYLDGGALVWDIYEESGISPAGYTPYNLMNILTIPRILDLTNDKKINIVEIGAGNGKPLFEFLRTLVKDDKINSYISIDISSKMNEIQRRNLKLEFPKLDFQSYVVDVENESFEDIIYQLHQEKPDVMNVIILYGGTIGNFFHPSKAIMNIEKSMLTGDLLSINNALPNPTRFGDDKFMYELPAVNHFLFASRSLGMEVGREDLEYYFDEKTTTRTLFLNLPADHTIKLKINGLEENIDLAKGMRIQVWQNRMTDLDYIQSVTKPFDLNLVLFTISSDNKFILTVHRKEAR